MLCATTGQIESNYDETTDSFDAMNLKSELLRGVYAYGFERPSAIQQRAIMPVIKGKPHQSKASPQQRTNVKLSRQRRHRTSAVWYRQDRDLLRLRFTEDRPEHQGMPSFDPRTNSRTRTTDPKSRRRHR
jgi:hypothetical protein